VASLPSDHLASTGGTLTYRARASSFRVGSYVLGNRTLDQIPAVHGQRTSAESCNRMSDPPAARQSGVFNKKPNSPLSSQLRKPGTDFATPTKGFLPTIRNCPAFREIAEEDFLNADSPTAVPPVEPGPAPRRSKSPNYDEARVLYGELNDDGITEVVLLS
jgi:hypothetical protein